MVQPPSITDLPSPPPGRVGWPWTESSPSRGLEGPSISVVVPSFDQGGFIEETIRSVLLQSYPSVELIVMDGGSTDRTTEILQKYDPWITHWTSQRDDGQASAINEGMRHATGEFVAFQNSDDLYAPGAFWAVAGAADRRPDADIVYGDMTRIDESGGRIDERRYVHASYWATLHGGFSMNNQSAFFRRELWEGIGGITVLDHPGFDYDLILRALKASRRVKHLRTVLGTFRVHAGSLTSAPDAPHHDPEVIKRPHLGALADAPKVLRSLLHGAALTRRSFLYVAQGDAGYVVRGLRRRLLASRSGR